LYFENRRVKFAVGAVFYTIQDQRCMESVKLWGLTLWAPHVSCCLITHSSQKIYFKIIPAAART